MVGLPAIQVPRMEALTHSNTGINQVPMHDQRPITPTSKAVNVARKILSPKAHTPRFDPAIHVSSDSSFSMDRKSHDSFVGAIESRTPARMTEEMTVDGDAQQKPAGDTPGAVKDDSFSEHIVSRSPVRLTLRIEDSVEAIDALEDALEQIGQALPKLPDEPQSPVKASKDPNLQLKRDETTSMPVETKERKIGSARKPVIGKVTKTSPISKTTSDPRKRVSVSQSNAKVPAPMRKPAATTPQDGARRRPAVTPKGDLRNSKTRASVTRHTTTKSTAAESGSTTATATSEKSTPPSTTSDQTNTANLLTKKPRVSSLLAPPFIPAKSSKPPTRSTFTLPGEAVAQKLKAAREERLAREEAERVQARQFKARPVRKSVAPAVEVRGTISSRSRLSVAGRTASGSGDNAPKKGPVIRPLARISSTGSTLTNVDGHTAPKTQHKVTARAAAVTTPAAPKGEAKAKPNASAPRMNSSDKSGAAGKRASTFPKASGKEVFARGKVEEEARLKDRKEKEEAAKRARVEAAERGRIASREWAEKMRAKKASASAGAKNGTGVGTEVEVAVDSTNT